MKQVRSGSKEVIWVGKYQACGGLGGGSYQIDHADMVWAAVSVKRDMSDNLSPLVPRFET